MKYFWIIKKFWLITIEKIFVIVLEIVATTPQKSNSNPKMPPYGDFIASPPTSLHTEGKNHTIAGKSKKKYYFNLLIFRWSTNLNLTASSIYHFLRPTVCHQLYCRNHDYWHTYVEWLSFLKNFLLGCC